jgi:hypothetical protein
MAGIRVHLGKRGVQRTSHAQAWASTCPLSALAFSWDSKRPQDLAACIILDTRVGFLPNPLNGATGL